MYAKIDDLSIINKLYRISNYCFAKNYNTITNVRKKYFWGVCSQVRFFTSE